MRKEDQKQSYHLRKEKKSEYDTEYEEAEKDRQTYRQTDRQTENREEEITIDDKSKANYLNTIHS